MSGESSPCGILVVDKPAGITSSDVVVRLRRLMGTRQIGHTGTLDPMATGVLPVLIGRAVKASDYLTAEEKEYAAEMTLGLTTDTEDTTGRVLSTTDALPGEAEVRAAAAAFLGETEQTPPMVSALKIGGRKLLDLARAGVTVERAPRPIVIRSLSLTPLAPSRWRLDVRCSKGTYIRTLCADIGRALGCGAAMSALRRVASGPFTLDDAVTLEALEAMPPEARAALLFPVERFFQDCPALALPDFYARLVRNGCAVLLKKLAADQPIGTLLRLTRGGAFFALGRVVETVDGPAVKAEKIFVL